MDVLEPVRSRFLMPAPIIPQSAPNASYEKFTMEWNSTLPSTLPPVGRKIQRGAPSRGAPFLFDLDEFDGGLLIGSGLRPTPSSARQ